MTFRNVDNDDWFRLICDDNGLTVTTHWEGQEQTTLIPASSLTEPLPVSVVTASYQTYITAYDDGTPYPDSDFAGLKMIVHAAATAILDMTTADAVYAGFVDHLLIDTIRDRLDWLPPGDDYEYRVELNGLVLLVDGVEYGPPQYADDATPVILTEL